MEQDIVDTDTTLPDLAMIYTKPEDQLENDGVEGTEAGGLSSHNSTGFTDVSFSVPNGLAEKLRDLASQTGTNPDALAAATLG